MLFLARICCHRTEPIKSGGDKGEEADRKWMKHSFLKFTNPTVQTWIWTQMHNLEDNSTQQFKSANSWLAKCKEKSISYRGKKNSETKKKKIRKIINNK